MEVEEDLYGRTQDGVFLLERGKLSLRGFRHCMSLAHACVRSLVLAVMSLPTGRIAELSLPTSRSLHHRTTTGLAPGFCFDVAHPRLTFTQS